MHARRSSMRGMLPRAAPCSGTRRGSPYDHRRWRRARCSATFADMGLDALIVIGGNGSLSVACQLHSDFGLPIVGVPKTIDNDIVGTDLTFGFNTAVQIATDAIDRLHTTAESHDRVMVVEVMGRHAAGSRPTPASPVGPRSILIPELPFDIDEVCDRILPASRAWPVRVDRRRRRRRRCRWTGTLDIGDRECTTSSVTCASAASAASIAHAIEDAHRLRDARRCCSATSSAAAHRRPSTACCRRGTASRRSTRCTTGHGAR